MSHKIVIDELNNVVQITAPGPQGVQGPAGTTLRYGAGAPTSGDGNDGDFWVDTTNDRLYGPKAAGAWPAEYTSLIGPANTLTIGTVTTGPTNGTAAASISGTAPNQVLDLTLPAGPTGPAINLGSALPLPLGAAALAGTATAGSREDHVHSSAGVTVTLLQAYVKNGSGGALSKGDAVYISGADGSNVLISKADANSDPSSSKTLGLLSQDLAINELGYVTTEGLVSGINTASATAGQSVWLSTTAGQWVFGSPPAEPAHGVYLGVVARANANNGEILVKVQNGYELDELHDVFAGSPTNGHLLRYDASSTAWINGQALGTSIAAGAVGSANIAVGAVGGTHIAVGAVAGTNIAIGAVGGTHIANGAVSNEKITSGTAASGYALIANGSGSALWQETVSPVWQTGTITFPAIPLPSPNITFNGTYISANAGSPTYFEVGGQGTQLAALSPIGNTTGSANLRIFNLNLAATAAASVAATSTAAFARVNASLGTGSILDFASTGFTTAGTSWVFRIQESGGGTNAMYYRKVTSAATNPWNTTLYSPSTVSIAQGWTSLQYAPEIDAWYGVETGNSASSTSNAFIINNQTGTKYNAAIHTKGTSVSDIFIVPSLVFVPSTSGSAGTIHVAAYGTTITASSTTSFTKLYSLSVGTASISAVSTAGWTTIGLTDSFTGNRDPHDVDPSRMLWDPVATAVVVTPTNQGALTFGQFILLDRSLSSVIARIPYAESTARGVNTLGVSEGTRGYSAGFDPIGRNVLVGSNGRYIKTGGAGNLWAGYWFGDDGVSDSVGFAGTAESTHIIGVAVATATSYHLFGNSVTYYPLSGTIAANPYARIISMKSIDAPGPASLAFAGIYAHGARIFSTGLTGGTPANRQNYITDFSQFILPANTGATVYMYEGDDLNRSSDTYVEFESIRLG